MEYELFEGKIIKVVETSRQEVTDNLQRLYSNKASLEIQIDSIVIEINDLEFFIATLPGEGEENANE